MNLTRTCRTLGLLALLAAPGAHAGPEWVERSNDAAQPYLTTIGEYFPESAGQLGLTGYDDRVQQLPLDGNARIRAALEIVRTQLDSRLAAEKDPTVRQDIQILLASAGAQGNTIALQDKYLRPYTDVGQVVFQGVFSLLDDQVVEQRRASALTRLKRYTGLERGYTPLTEQAKALWAASASNGALLGPYRPQVEQNLGNTQRYLDGIRALFAKYRLKGADKALAALEGQLRDYDAWVRSEVVAHARADFRLPPELYADNLRSVGIDLAPEELVRRAEVAYSEIRNQLRIIAPLVAKERGLGSSDYRDVLRALKRESIPNERLEADYRVVIGRIEETIRRERIVTLPAREMLMRVASEAESAQQPAPHMQPPPLIGNHGERGTFVLPLGLPGAKKADQYDDFNSPSASWTLTAHEGRPGHELQYSAMIERGVSTARAVFAFNSVNVEGWALYAEAEMQPYEPLDAQMFALQARLVRVARAMLDPRLNLGTISKERAKQILVDEVVISAPLAQQEIDRYTFRSPGQAGSYFYGYQRLMQLRAETELALAERFDRKAFNDFIIGQGLLPPDLLAKAVRDDFDKRAP